MRCAKSEDVTWITSIARQAEELTGFLRSPSIVLGEVKAGRIVRNEAAFMYFRVRRDGVGVIYDIATDPSKRRKGHATQLVDYLKQRCCTVELLCSQRNSRGCSFYESQDFRVLNESRRWNRRKGRYSDYYKFRWHRSNLEKGVEEVTTSEELLNDRQKLMPGGGVSWHQFENPDSRILSTFPKPGKSDCLVTFETEELTALCPLTGFPDFYTVKIQYVPDESCVESKSAKFYFGAYRGVKAFAETLCDQLLTDWVRACKPLRAEVILRMKPRGGIVVEVTRQYDSSK